MRPRAAGGIAIAVLAAGTAFTFASAGAAAASATLPTNLEAWYETLGCSNAAVGCGLVTPPQDPYPANTLHIGNAAGMPYEETFITLDTSSITGTVASGTLTLPLATDNQAATANPSAARFIACLATSGFTSAEFVTSTPPATDCSVSSAATFDAATQSFSLDLAPFITRGGGSLTNLGIGLLPDPTDATGTWQLTFNGRNRMLDGQSPITAAVTPAPAAPIAGAPAVPKAGAPAGVPPAIEIPAGPPPSSSRRIPPTVKKGARTTPATAAPLPRASTNTGKAGPSAVVPVESLPSAAPAVVSIAGAQLAPVIQRDGVADGVPLVPESTQRITPVSLRTSNLLGGQYGLVWAVPLGLLAIAFVTFRAATTEHVIEKTEEHTT